MRRWRIYYGDGSTFDWSMGPPEAAPSFDVQAIVQDSDPADAMAPLREVVDKRDWYCFDPARSEWYGVDLPGLLDRLLHNVPTGAVKAGRTIPTLMYRRIMERVYEDPDFPKAR